MHDNIMQPLPWLCPLASPLLSAMPPALPTLRPMTYTLAPPLHMHDAYDVTYNHALHMTSPCITFDYWHHLQCAHHNIML